MPFDPLFVQRVERECGIYVDNMLVAGSGGIFVVLLAPGERENGLLRGNGDDSSQGTHLMSEWTLSPKLKAQKWFVNVFHFVLAVCFLFCCFFFSGFKYE